MDVHNAAQRLLEVMEGRCHCGEDVWRSVLNREAVHLQNRNSLPVATELARNALRQLEIDGIAVFPLSALAGGNSRSTTRLPESGKLLQRCKENSQRSSGRRLPKNASF